MKICVECGKQWSLSIKIDGKRRNLKNRTKCLKCLPFGQSRYRKKSIEEHRTYNAEKARKHYHKYKNKHGIDPVKKHRLDRKVQFLNLVDGKCQICGYNRAARNLSFHHLTDKDFSLSTRGMQFGIEKILPELKKCAVVCHNCHGEIHDGLIKQSVVIAANEHFKFQLERWASSSVGQSVRLKNGSAEEESSDEKPSKSVNSYMDNAEPSPKGKV